MGEAFALASCRRLAGLGSVGARAGVSGLATPFAVLRLGKVPRPRLEHHLVRVAAFSETAVELGQSVPGCAPKISKCGLPRHDQIPAPPSNDSLRALAWVMLLPAGTLWVSQTLPPIEAPLPMVTRPRMVAPA